jgi:hypothetical protein
MAFAMAKLKRLKSGAISARKVIPKDVRALRRRLGGAVHAKAGTPLGSAG